MATQKMKMKSLIIAILLSLNIVKIEALFGGTLPDGSECSLCPPGYGVTRMCDKDASLDTKCQECVDGTYNERYTSELPCIDCTQCTAMHYAWRACSRIKDAVCLPCWSHSRAAERSGPAFGNEDYLRECEGKTTTVPTTPTTSTTTTTLPPTTTITTTTTTSTTTTPSTTTTLPPTTTPLPTTTPSPTTTPLPTTTLELTTIVVTSPTTTTKLPAPPSTVLDLEGLDLPHVSIPATDDNTTVAAYEVAEVATSSSNWIIIVAILGGAVLVFILGGVIAVCMKTKKMRQKDNHGEYDVTSGHDEESGWSDDDVIRKDAFGDSDDVIDAARTLDITQPLFSEPPTNDGLVTSGTPMLTHSTPDLSKRTTPRTVTPRSLASGHSGPENSLQHPPVMDPQDSQPSGLPIVVQRVTPLTGLPAMNSMDSPANSPKKRLPMFPSKRRTQPPAPSNGTPVMLQKPEEDDDKETTPLTCLVEPNNSAVSSPNDTLHDTTQDSNTITPASSVRSTPKHFKRWLPKSKTPTPTASEQSTPGQPPRSITQKPPQSRKRAWPSKRMRGSFNRNLPYIDEDSGDEIVQHTGRPPQTNFKDPKDKRVWGLTRQMTDLFDRIRGRRPRRTSSNASHDVSRDLDDSRIDDTMNDISFDVHNTSVISTDYHNTTAASEVSSEFYNPHLRYQYTDTQL